MTKVQPDQHIPVLCEEIVDFCDQVYQHRVEQKQLPFRYFDGTFGRGGHMKAILQKCEQTEVTAFDQDLQAIDFAKTQFAAEIESKKIQIFHRNFADLCEGEFPAFDFMLIDLGVSSPQLDQPARGFSFYHDGPLDMRMNQNQSLSAETVVNEYDEEDLIRIFREYGEIGNPTRVVKAILEDRPKSRFTTTLQLASMIERICGWHKKGFHPATLYFQAIRIEVNQELAVVESSVESLTKCLAPGGRLAVITFHSLEDRIVKYKMKDLEALGKPVNKKVIQPSWADGKKNVRARSAKLRVFQRA